MIQSVSRVIPTPPSTRSTRAPRLGRYSPMSSSSRKSLISAKKIMFGSPACAGSQSNSTVASAGATTSIVSVFLSLSFRPAPHFADRSPPTSAVAAARHAQRSLQCSVLYGAVQQPGDAALAGRFVAEGGLPQVDLLGVQRLQGRVVSVEQRACVLDVGGQPRLELRDVVVHPVQRAGLVLGHVLGLTPDRVHLTVALGQT